MYRIYIYIDVHIKYWYIEMYNVNMWSEYKIWNFIFFILSYVFYNKNKIVLKEY